MRSDQELIDGLRSELAAVHPRSDLIDRLRERVVADQAHEPRSQSPRRPRWLPGVGALVVTASVMATVVIGGGALALVGAHDWSAHGPAIRSTESTPDARPARPAVSTVATAGSAHHSLRSRRRAANHRTHPARHRATPPVSGSSNAGSSTSQPGQSCQAGTPGCVNGKQTSQLFGGSSPGNQQQHSPAPPSNAGQTRRNMGSATSATSQPGQSCQAGTPGCVNGKQTSTLFGG